MNIVLGAWALWAAIGASVIAVGIFARGLARIIAVLRLGAPAGERLRPIGPRLARMITEVLSHTRFAGRPWIAVAHWTVMLSFPLLFTSLIQSYANLVDAHWRLPFFGTFAPWIWLTEIFAWAGLLAIATLMIVRSIGRRSRFAGSTHWQARFVEWVIAIVVACVLIIHGAHAALTPGQLDIYHYPLTAWIGAGLRLAGASPNALAWIICLVGALKIATSLAWFVVVGLIPSAGVAWHRFLALINVYARREVCGAPALGALEPMRIGGQDLTAESLEDLPDDAALGPAHVTDLTWKTLLDTATCTECGRCQDLCPAWMADKPLSPKLFTLELRDHAFASAPFIKAARAGGAIGKDDAAGDASADASGDTSGDTTADPTLYHSQDILGALLESGMSDPTGVAVGADIPLVPEVVKPETLWACTTCGACVDQCPVDIEHIDHIIDLRRHQVMMESAFPRELGTAFRNMEKRGNPYGINARKRLDWAKKLPFEVPVVGIDVEDAEQVDYLFWVGCAGAFDDRAKKTTQAVAELLHTAGVSFAVLGDGESCTGDPARRAGNEILFQMLAAQNIEVMREAKVKRIVVSCAHCFNTIGKEYPQLDGHFEVVHHTQLLNRLVRDGKLRPVPPPVEERKTITFHDACYLGRHNQVYSPPRELVSAASGAPVVEMAHSRERALCCGAGGAHAFFEDRTGGRISELRADEASASGASVLATACPFCTTMLSAEGGRREDMPEVRDVAQLLLDAVHRGQGAIGEAEDSAAE